MPPVIETSDLTFPDWLFEQDYMVFLSFFGWTLLGLLAWTKPLCDSQKGEARWFWFGYFAFAEAMGDFVRTLSFSDPFFRSFSIEIPLEMLGLGCLIEAHHGGARTTLAVRAAAAARFACSKAVRSMTAGTAGGV